MAAEQEPAGQTARTARTPYSEPEIEDQVELTPEQAIERVGGWLAEPHRLYGTLAIRGEPGAGKTQLLRELSTRMPDAVFVDCRGLTADDVAQFLLREFDAAESPASLISGALSIRSGGVGLLANVQWADRFVTSNEPSRITQQVIRTLKQFSRPTLQFVVERSADRPWVLAPARNDIVLTSPIGRENGDDARFAEVARLVERYPSLQALAAAELSTISLSLWAELCRCLDIQASPGELGELPEALADLLITYEVSETEREVGFRAESDRYRIRRLHPVDQGSLLSSLLRQLETHDARSNRTTSALGRYAAQTVGVHAAPTPAASKTC